MELVAYLGTVVTIAVIAVGAMYAIVGQLGRRIDQSNSGLGARIDDVGSSLGARIDEVRSDLGTRITRVETQNDQILDAVADLGQRVSRLEAQRR